MLQLKKQSLIAGVSALILSTTVLVGCSGSSGSSTDAGSAGSASSASASKGTLLEIIPLGLGTDASTGFGLQTVTSSAHDKYFKPGVTAAAAVANIIAAGNYYINGIAIPATATDCTSKYPNGYLVNQVAWLSGSGTSWTGGGATNKVTGTDYATAALAAANAITPGNEVRLYDLDGDGYPDLIDADYKAGVTVTTITKNSYNTYSVSRGDIDTANKTSYEGNAFDGAHFTTTSGEKIKAADFDTTISPGDIALFWYGPDGWAMQRAVDVDAIFVTGSDHVSYNMGGVVYQDAMMFSRDNQPISNRPGEFANAQKYFGFVNNGEGLNTHLWAVPRTNPDAQTDPSALGAPIGLTSGVNAKTFLAEAIYQAVEKLDSAVVSANGTGTDVPTTEMWVTQTVHDQLNSAIVRAKADLASPASTSLILDYQTYLLYLAINGVSSDIGAKFENFTYAAFAPKAGTQQ